MSALKLVDLESLARLGVAPFGTGPSAWSEDDARDRLLPLDWPELTQVLPDGGIPRGVVELSSLQLPLGSLGTRRGSRESAFAKCAALRGGATSIALAAVRGVHLANESAWCAWLTEDTAPSLYAPAVAKAGVDLERLLVVRPPQHALARTAVKVATSGAFDLVIVDAPSGLTTKLTKHTRANLARGVDETVVVRKLSLAASDRGTSTILLTSAYSERAQSLPVALRLEVERRPESLSIRVTKDRRGSSSSQHVVRLGAYAPLGQAG